MFFCSQLQTSVSQPHYLEGFEVLYRSILPASSDWTAQSVPQPALHTHVGPLKRGYKYEFKVRPYGSGLYGRESNTRHLRVPEIGENPDYTRVTPADGELLFKFGKQWPIFTFYIVAGRQIHPSHVCIKPMTYLSYCGLSWCAGFSIYFCQFI